MQEKIENLKTDLSKITAQLEQLTQLRFKILGAIEVLESIENESDKEEVEDASQ